MTFEIKSLLIAITKLKNLTEALRRSISREWQDEVKESYLKYISQCEDLLNSVKKVADGINERCSVLSRIDVDAIIYSAQQARADTDRRL